MNINFFFNASRKYVVIFILGIFFSLYGEMNALKFNGLPKIPKVQEINPKILSIRVVSAILFGGFRGILVNLTWIYADYLWHQARFYRLPYLFEIITTVQPEYIDGWVMGGWHMAYNMSYELPNVKNISKNLRKKIELEWVYKGINFLKAGALMNPDDAQIYFEIGWTYYHRLKDYRSSIEWFKKSASKHNSRYITHRLVALAYEKVGDLKSAYEQWISLKKHISYKECKISKKVIDKHILRIENILRK